MAALLFEAKLAEFTGTLYGQFMETVLHGNEPTFISVFEGKLRGEELDRFSSEIEPFCTFEVLVKAGDVDTDEGTVSDSTLLECSPTPGTRAYKLPTTRTGSASQFRTEPGRDVPGSRFLPRTGAAYEAVHEDGGLSDAAFRVLYAEAEHENGSAAIKRAVDGNGVAWLFHEDVWLPDLESLDEARYREGDRVLVGPKKQKGVIKGAPGKKYREKFGKDIAYRIVFDNGTSQYIPADDFIKESLDEASAAEKKLARKMKAKGHKVVLVLPKAEGEPLYFKTAAEASRISREEYPNAKIMPIDKFIGESMGEAEKGTTVRVTFPAKAIRANQKLTGQIWGRIVNDAKDAGGRLVGGKEGHIASMKFSFKTTKGASSFAKSMKKSRPGMAAPMMFLKMGVKAVVESLDEAYYDQGMAGTIVKDRMKKEGKPRNVLGLKWTNALPIHRVDELVGQYGEPQTIGRDRVVWTEGVAPFSEIMVKDEMVPHMHPKPHVDFFYASVDYPIPASKVQDVLDLTESVFYDSLTERVTARCDAWAPNIVTLHLAKRIAEGSISPHIAERMYSPMIMRGAEDPTFLGQLRETLVLGESDPVTESGQTGDDYILVNAAGKPIPGAAPQKMTPEEVKAENKRPAIKAERFKWVRALKSKHSFPKGRQYESGQTGDDYVLVRDKTGKPVPGMAPLKMPPEEAFQLNRDLLKQKYRMTWVKASRFARMATRVMRRKPALRYEDLDEATEYQAFFKQMMKKAGVPSIKALGDDEKKEFFARVGAAWRKRKKGKTDTREDLDEALPAVATQKIRPNEIKDVKSQLRRRTKFGSNGYKFRAGQRVTYKGKKYLVFDLDAVPEAPGGATATLVTPDLKAFLRYVPMDQLGTGRKESLDEQDIRTIADLKDAAEELVKTAKGDAKKYYQAVLRGKRKEAAKLLKTKGGASARVAMYRKADAPLPESLDEALYYEDDTQIQSKFAAWTVRKEGTDDGKTLVSIGDRHFTIAQDLQEVKAAIEKIESFYGDLPEEFDCMVEAFLEEFCEAEGEVAEGINTVLIEGEDEADEEGRTNLKAQRDRVVERNGKLRLLALHGADIDTVLMGEAAVKKGARVRILKNIGGPTKGKMGRVTKIEGVGSKAKYWVSLKGFQKFFLTPSDFEDGHAEVLESLDEATPDKAELKAALTRALSNMTKAMKKKGVIPPLDKKAKFDYAKKRLVSADGKYSLQWRPDGISLTRLGESLDETMLGSLKIMVKDYKGAVSVSKKYVVGHFKTMKSADGFAGDVRMEYPDAKIKRTGRNVTVDLKESLDEALKSPFDKDAVKAGLSSKEAAALKKVVNKMVRMKGAGRNIDEFPFVRIFKEKGHYQVAARSKSTEPLKQFIVPMSKVGESLDEALRNDQVQVIYRISDYGKGGPTPYDKVVTASGVVKPSTVKTLVKKGYVKQQAGNNLLVTPSGEKAAGLQKLVPVSRMKKAAFKAWSRDVQTTGTQRMIETVFYDKRGKAIGRSYMLAGKFEDAPGEAKSLAALYKMPGFQESLGEAKAATLPPGVAVDPTTWTKATRKKVIAYYAKWPLKKLRRHQDLIMAQQERAGGNKQAMARLQMIERLLAAAVEKREFSESLDEALKYPVKKGTAVKWVAPDGTKMKGTVVSDVAPMHKVKVRPRAPGSEDVIVDRRKLRESLEEGLLGSLRIMVKDWKGTASEGKNYFMGKFKTEKAADGFARNVRMEYPRIKMKVKGNDVRVEIVRLFKESLDEGAERTVSDFFPKGLPAWTAMVGKKDISVIVDKAENKYLTPDWLWTDKPERAIAFRMLGAATRYAKKVTKFNVGPATTLSRILQKKAQGESLDEGAAESMRIVGKAVKAALQKAFGPVTTGPREYGFAVKVDGTAWLIDVGGTRLDVQTRAGKNKFRLDYATVRVPKKLAAAVVAHIKGKSESLDEQKAKLKLKWKGKQITATEPTHLKALAKKAGVSTKRALRLWAKAQIVVTRQYPEIKKKSSRYYQAATGIMKKMMKLPTKPFTGAAAEAERFVISNLLEGPANLKAVLRAAKKRPGLKASETAIKKSWLLMAKDGLLRPAIGDLYQYEPIFWSGSMGTVRRLGASVETVLRNNTARNNSSGDFNAVLIPERMHGMARAGMNAKAGRTTAGTRGGRKTRRRRAYREATRDVSGDIPLGLQGSLGRNPRKMRRARDLARGPQKYRGRSAETPLWSEDLDEVKGGWSALFRDKKAARAFKKAVENKFPAVTEPIQSPLPEQYYVPWDTPHRKNDEAIKRIAKKMGGESARRSFIEDLDEARLTKRDLKIAFARLPKDKHAIEKAADGTYTITASNARTAGLLLQDVPSGYTAQRVTKSFEYPAKFRIVKESIDEAMTAGELADYLKLRTVAGKRVGSARLKKKMTSAMGKDVPSGKVTVTILGKKVHVAKAGETGGAVFPVGRISRVLMPESLDEAATSISMVDYQRIRAASDKHQKERFGMMFRKDFTKKFRLDKKLADRLFEILSRKHNFPAKWEKDRLAGLKKDGFLKEDLDESVETADPKAVKEVLKAVVQAEGRIDYRVFIDSFSGHEQAAMNGAVQELMERGFLQRQSHEAHGNYSHDLVLTTTGYERARAQLSESQEDHDALLRVQQTLSIERPMDPEDELFWRRQMGEAEEENLLTPDKLKPGVKLKGGWRIVKATKKTVTIMPAIGAAARAGSRFAGKKFTARWDGTGYKSGGSYLRVEEDLDEARKPPAKVQAGKARATRISVFTTPLGKSGYGYSWTDGKEVGNFDIVTMETGAVMGMKPKPRFEVQVRRKHPQPPKAIIDKIRKAVGMRESLDEDKIVRDALKVAVNAIEDKDRTDSQLRKAVEKKLGKKLTTSNWNSVASMLNRKGYSVSQKGIWFPESIEEARFSFAEVWAYHKKRPDATDADYIKKFGMSKSTARIVHEIVSEKSGIQAAMKAFDKRLVGIESLDEAMSKTDQKRALTLVQDLLLQRKQKNVKREQAAHNKLRAFADKRGVDFNALLTQATKTLKKKGVAFGMMGLGEAVSQVAKTIQQQIGRRSFMMMGAKQLVGDKKSLMWSVGKNAKGVTKVRVTLTPADEYNVEFIRIRKKAGVPEVKVLKTVKGIQVDELHKTIQAGTGMRLSLTRTFEDLDEAKRSFSQWLKLVDRYVEMKTGMSLDDLPDVPLRDWYDDGKSPKSAAAKALRMAKESVDEATSAKQVQQKILTVVRANPRAKFELSAIAPRLPGVHFKRIQSAAKALRKKGEIDYDGISMVSLKEAVAV